MATLLDSIQDKYGADEDADREEYGWIVFVSNSPECKKGMFPPIMTLSDYDISSIGNTLFPFLIQHFFLSDTMLPIANNYVCDLQDYVILEAW